MDSFEVNKILGAILGTLLFLFVVKEAAHILYPGDEEPEELAYKVEIPETEPGQAREEEPKQVDFGTLLQQASAERGQSVARRCLQCHSFEKGGPNKTGPNLWGILGSDIAAKPDFRYSNALSQIDGKWTYEALYEFVGAPSRYAPGTNMNFAGLRRQQERINLLAYLRTQADEPPPIPEPLPEETSEEADQGAESPEGPEGPAGEKAGDAAPGDASGEEDGTDGKSDDDAAAKDTGAAGDDAAASEAAPDEETGEASHDAGEKASGGEDEADAAAEEESGESPN